MKVAQALEQAKAKRGRLPGSITVDNGNEFSSRALEAWLMNLVQQTGALRIHFRFGGGQGKSSNRDWTAPASSVQASCTWGKHALSDIRYFVHRLCDCDAMLTKYSSQCDIFEISVSCLPASSLPLGNDGQSSLMQELTDMKNEKLKSTTVRFTDSDLRLIDSLQEKRGLGMIHVIRLAIRRLAESENLVLSKSAR